jgi:hypothetical protein
MLVVQDERKRVRIRPEFSHRRGWNYCARQAIAAALPSARGCIDATAALRSGDYLCGDALSIADIMLAAHLDPFAATAEGEAMLAQSRLGDWLARMQGARQHDGDGAREPAYSALKGFILSWHPGSNARAPAGPPARRLARPAALVERSRRMAVIPGVIWLAALVGTTQIESTVSCPSADAVAETLPALVGSRPTVALRARVSAEGPRLRVELAAPGSEAPLVRVIDDVPADCAVRALVAGVLIAAYQAQRPNDGMALIMATAPTATSAKPALTLLRAVAPRAHLTIDLGAALVASVADRDFGAGAALEVWLGSSQSGWAAALGVRGTSLYRLHLNAGTTESVDVEWTRAPLDISAAYRYRRGRWMIGPHGEALVALVYTRTKSSSSDARRFDYNVGLGTGVRVGVHTRFISPFVDISVAGWLRPESAALLPHADTTPLPQLEIVALAGFDVDVRR